MSRPSSWFLSDGALRAGRDEFPALSHYPKTARSAGFRQMHFADTQQFIRSYAAQFGISPEEERGENTVKANMDRSHREDNRDS